MFTVTPPAAAQILRAAEQQTDNSALRVAAKRDESGEIVYGMGFDEERENDLVIQSEGLTILIGPHSRELLEGATLDFVELHPGEFQFIFLNPNDAAALAPGCATRNSGCGGCGGTQSGCG
jgi:iron-sulfur cluster assembly protein